jgi:hypothetical protein
MRRSPDTFSASELEAEFARLGDGAVAQQALEPLRITVPASGVHHAFEKLCAPPNERGALLETGLLDATAPQRHGTTR